VRDRDAEISRAPDDERPQPARESFELATTKAAGSSGVRERDMEFVGAARGGEFGGRTVQHHRRRTTRRALHFNRFHGTEPAPTLSDFMTASLREARSQSLGFARASRCSPREESLDDSGRRPRTISKRGTSTTSMPTPTVATIRPSPSWRGSAPVDVSTKTARHGVGEHLQ